MNMSNYCTQPFPSQPAVRVLPMGRYSKRKYDLDEGPGAEYTPAETPVANQRRSLRHSLAGSSSSAPRSLASQDHTTATLPSPNHRENQVNGEKESEKKQSFPKLQQNPPRVDDSIIVDSNDLRGESNVSKPLESDIKTPQTRKRISQKQTPEAQEADTAVLPQTTELKSPGRGSTVLNGNKEQGLSESDTQETFIQSESADTDSSYRVNPPPVYRSSTLDSSLTAQNRVGQAKVSNVTDPTYLLPHSKDQELAQSPSYTLAPSQGRTQLSTPTNNQSRVFYPQLSSQNSRNITPKADSTFIRHGVDNTLPPRPQNYIPDNYAVNVTQSEQTCHISTPNACQPPISRSSHQFATTNPPLYAQSETPKLQSFRIRRHILQQVSASLAAAFPTLAPDHIDMILEGYSSKMGLSELIQACADAASGR